MKLRLIKELADTGDKSEKDKATPTASGDLGQYITTKQAAAILGVDQSRVRQFIQEKRLKAHHPVPGRRDNFLLRADVEAFDKEPRERTGRPDEGKGTSDDK
jgi:excisionase family DNA binding protein